MFMYIQINNIKMKKIIIIILVVITNLTTISCVTSDVYEVPDLSSKCVTLIANKTVSSVTSTATSAYKKYIDDDIIEAYVTSTDEGGNFYKSISLVSTDGLTAFSMTIDAYNLSNKFEPGRKVYIKMKDLYYVTENGSTLFGSLFNNDTPTIATDDKVGRIAATDIDNIILQSCEKVDESTITVKGKTITEIINSNNFYVNKLIELKDVQFTDQSIGKTYFDASLNSPGGATNHDIADANGAKVILRVSEFAKFAGVAVNPKKGTIVGVLTKFGSTFQFMVRLEKDIKLTETRF